MIGFSQALAQIFTLPFLLAARLFFAFDLESPVPFDSTSVLYQE